MNSVLDHVRASRDTAKLELRAMLDSAERENRDLGPGEKVEYDHRLALVKELDARVAELELVERGADGVRREMPTGASLQVRSEPRTYSPNPAGPSYFRDLLARHRDNDGAASERLARHRTEVERETRDISRVDGAGGELVPPLWLIDSYVDLPRVGRAICDLFSSMPLPPGTDSINLPKITTGPQVAAQTADNASVQETDSVTSSVVGPVRTIAGHQDVAIQLVEQSPLSGGLDRLIFDQLLRDYARVLEGQSWTGTGASGQLTGVLTLAGTGSVTYTDASPTVPEMYLPITQSLANVMTNRVAAPNAIAMSTRRWAWMLGALDTSNRPLVVPSDAGPTNAVAALNGLEAGGIVGRIASLPVVGSLGCPVNLGAGTNEDRIVTGLWTDSILMEGATKTRVLPDVLSGNLTIRFQLYKYVALVHRNATAYCVISGTGQIVQSGY